jgi:hypothetical protein
MAQARDHSRDNPLDDLRRNGIIEEHAERRA